MAQPITSSVVLRATTHQPNPSRCLRTTYLGQSIFPFPLSHIPVLYYSHGDPRLPDQPRQFCWIIDIGNADHANGI